MASTDTPIDHSCDAWQADSSIIPNDVPSRPYDQFYIKIYANFTRLPPHAADDDDYLLMIHSLDCTTTVPQFWVSSPPLIRDDSSCFLVSEMLSQVGVPLDLHPFMTSRIVSTAQSIAADAHNVGSRVLPMLVSIDVIQYDDDDDGPTQESADTQEATLPLSVSIETAKVENDKVARAA